VWRSENLPRKVDPALLKAVARAKTWFEELASGRVRSLTDIARREKIAPRYEYPLKSVYIIFFSTILCLRKTPSGVRF